MKIVSWNCNGAFRNKYKVIQNLLADIYVIQECENPEEIKDVGYNKFASNFSWEGYNNKGVGIFASNDIVFENNHWNPFGLEHFLCLKVNNNYNLLGVWAKNGYIKDVYTYLKIFEEELDKVIICGDFNSNHIWDKKNVRRTHASVINILEAKGLYSCYHLKSNEKQGEESIPTFYLHKDKNKPFHIDYFFCNKNKLINIEIGKYDEWISFSDHMPLILNLEVPNI